MSNTLVRDDDTGTGTGTDTGDDDSGNIDLMGWDTVFALGLDALNASIVAQNTTPPQFQGTDKQGGAAVSGTWGPWSVTGGEGDGIILNCPVKTGTLTVPGMSDVPLDGGSVTVQITLHSKPSDQELPDPTAEPGSGSTVHFLANQTDDPFQKPTVQGVSFTGVTGLLVYAAEGAFGAYFDANVAEFDAVFAAARLEEQAVEADKAWLKPQVSLYALASSGTGTGTGGSTTTGGGSGTNQAFGILSLTSKPSGKLPQQNFDLRMFDVFADNPGTNSVFAVSAPLAMQNIVQASAQHCVMGSTMDDFHIVNNGITVANKNELRWGNFQLTKGDPTSIVTPVISPGDFQLTLDGSQFHLSISQAAFTTPDGTADIKLTADQYFNMGAAKLSDGKYYFVPDKGLGTNSIRADVTPNKGFEIFSIIEGIVVGVALGFLGGAIGEAIGDAVSGTVEGADGVISGTEESISDSLNDLDPEQIEGFENDSVEDAINSIDSDGESTDSSSGMFSNKYKVWGGILGGMLGIPISMLPQIMDLIWNDKIHEGNVPTVDQFATNFTGAIQWPQVNSWQVTGGTFRSAFLLGGQASA